MMRAIHLQIQQNFLLVLLLCVASILFSGCASTYGEKDLRSFEDDYGRSMPTSPQYKLEELSGERYSLTVHQGSPLFSPGYVRAEYLWQAATTIARDTCSSAGKEVVDSNLTRAGDSGWVHLQGTFTCAAKAVTEKKPKETDLLVRTGTGFFVSSAGHVITSNHVIAGATSIGIRNEAGQILPAKLVRSDPANDLALLDVETSGKPLVLSQTANISKGLEVFTLGYPLPGLQGQEQKATFGRVNALSGPQGDIRFVQVDVPIQPGNSGGPLIDANGHVIGVITGSLDELKALNTSGALPQNVNYAIKADYIMPLIGPVFEADRILNQPDAKKKDMSVLIRGAESSVVIVVAQ